MAGFNDPFTPGAGADPTAGIPDMNTFENLRNQWSTFLDQPGARAALLQTGIALMQPPRFGDTPASQIGRAVGEGAEAVTRGELVGSKIASDTARSEAATARSETAAQRIPLEYFRRQSIEQGQANQNVRAAQEAFRRDQKFIEDTYQARLKAYNDLTVPSSQRGEKPSPPPQMDFSTWLQSRGNQWAGMPGVREFLSGISRSPTGTQPTTQEPDDSGE